MRRFWTNATCTLAIILALAPDARGQQRILPVPLKLQNTLVWCWAASAAMVIEYETRQPIIDCQVLDAYARAMGRSGGCCQFPARCMRGAIPGEIEQILLGHGINMRSQQFPAPLHEVQQHLNRGHPLIIWLWRTPNSAHVVTIVGYRGSALLVHDPMQGAVWVQDQVLRANWLTGVWRDTIFVEGRLGGSSPGPTPTPPFPGPNPLPGPAPLPGPVPAHWCCTQAGRFGPYPPNDVPVGAPCEWMTPMGPARGIACN